MADFVGVLPTLVSFTQSLGIFPGHTRLRFFIFISMISSLAEEGPVIVDRSSQAQDDTSPAGGEQEASEEVQMEQGGDTIDLDDLNR